MRRLLVLLIVIGLFTLGCFGPAPTPGVNNDTAQAGNETPGNASPVGPSPPPSTGGTTGQLNDTNATNQTTSQPTPPEFNPPVNGTAGNTSLAGKAYAELLALNIPLQCDMTMPKGGPSTKARVYMQGWNSIRIEMTHTLGAVCPKTIYVVKDGDHHISCETGDIMPGCNWLLIAVEEEEEGMPPGSSYEAPDVADVPPDQITCVPWGYDSSKFAVSGKICSMQDTLNEIDTDKISRGIGGIPGETETEIIEE